MLKSTVCTAASASIQPEPVLLFFLSESFTAVVSMILHKSDGVSSGFFSSMRAITPATQGAAIEVPALIAYPSLLSLLSDLTLTPGAQMSGRMRPIPGLYE